MYPSPMTTAYDEVEYTSLPYPEAHPDRMFLVAQLFHREPTPVDRCRVLEIGCSSGGNLIPMAESLPGSTFVGFDLAASAVEIGLDAVRTIGLDNVKLEARDLAEFPADAGTFDYIICHGVYSWIPAPLRGTLLDLIARHLAPEGIAYISHLVKPGSYARVVARDIMQYHTRTLTDRSRFDQARAVMAFIAKGATHPAWKPMAEEQRDAIHRQPDWLLHHDYLGDIMDGVWLHEIVADARARGLDYLGDAKMETMLPVYVAPETRAKLDDIAGDAVAFQQYLDFLTFRFFRRTLLVHGGRAIDRRLQRENVRRLYVTTEAREDGGKFKMPAGGEVVVGRARTREAMKVLARTAPAAMRVDELARAIDADPAGADELTDAMLACFFEGIVELSALPPRCVAKAGERPRVPGYARWAALRARPIVNLRHEVVEVRPGLTAFLPLVDGTRDRAALRAQLPDADTLLDELARMALLSA
jgi:SAM-dependent methyltransferase